MNIDPALLERLPPERRELFEALQAEYNAQLTDNPLVGFHACAEPCGSPHCQAREKQHEFMAAMTRIVAAFAGNRFGKTVANVVWAIIQHTPDDMLPERLRVFKRPRDPRHGPVMGRYLVPTQKSIITIILPELRRWCPPAILKKGQWEKAWSSQHNILYFEDGGLLEFYTYESDPSSMVGSSRDYIIYDEPPPEGHWRECLIRTTDRAGCHRFGLTPVNMKGAGISWLKDEIFDNGDDPNVTIVRATIHDNPLLSKEEIAFTLGQYPEDERQAREFGDFIHFGGMVYPGGFRSVIVKDPTPEDLRYRDIVVGIDPGLKNAAFIWLAFDEDNRCLAFDEVLLQEKTPVDYARAIRFINSKWELRKTPIFVADPAIRARSLTNAESVQTELLRQGIPVMYGQNDVQAGVQQVRRRIQQGGFFVAKSCKGLFWEADRYLMHDSDDGEFKVVKENDHRMDALRYGVMSRPWYREFAAKLRDTPYQQGVAPSVAWFDANVQEHTSHGPLGSLS